MRGEQRPESNNKLEFPFTVPPYKKILPPASPTRAQVFRRKIKDLLLRPVPVKAETFGTPKLALLLMILIVCAQVGISMIDIQHKFVVGVMCWVAVFGFGVYIIWVWKRTQWLTSLGKFLFSLAIASIMLLLLWAPEKKQFLAERPRVLVESTKPGSALHVTANPELTSKETPKTKAYANQASPEKPTTQDRFMPQVAAPLPSQTKIANPPHKVPKVQPATPAGPKSEPNPDCIRLGDELDRFKDCSSEMVGNWAIGEADKIEDMAKKSIRDSIVPGMSGKDRSEFMAFQFRIFSDKFSKCCARDVRDLRAEILHRLGPPGEDLEEEETYKSLYQAFEFDPQSVDIYASMLRRLGRRLKLTLTADIGPIELNHSVKEDLGDHLKSGHS